MKRAYETLDVTLRALHGPQKSLQHHEAHHVSLCVMLLFLDQSPWTATANSVSSPTLHTLGFLSCPLLHASSNRRNAMSNRTNVCHSAPSPSCSMTPAPRVAAHDTGGVADHNAVMGNYPDLMTSSLPPPYKAYHELPDSKNKLPSGSSKNMSNHPPSYAHTKMPLAEQPRKHHHTSTPKGDVDQPLVHTGKGRIVLNLFHNRNKEDVRDLSEWPPSETKFLSDPNLPMRQLVSPFDRKFQKLKASAKTQEQWDELRRIQGGGLRSISSRKSRTSFR
jgi:hypothetical protein